METIIDDICGIIDEVDESSKRVEKIISNFNTNFKKDDITLNTIKKKIVQDSKIKRRREKNNTLIKNSTLKLPQTDINEFKRKLEEGSNQEEGVNIRKYANTTFPDFDNNNNNNE